MPIKSCQFEGQPGYKWGDQGKCYTYDPESERSQKSAKRKAIRQGVATGEFTGLIFEGQKISFDYDESLTTEKGMILAQQWISRGADVYIISANRSIDKMLSRAQKLGIPKSRIYATGSNKAKIEKIQELKISKHYDNNPDVIKALQGIGNII